MATRGSRYKLIIGMPTAWEDLPTGSYIEGFSHKKKVKVAKSPLAHGGVNIGDSKFAPNQLRVVTDLWHINAVSLRGDIDTLANQFNDNAGDFIKVMDAEGIFTAWEFRYDEMSDFEVTFVSFTGLLVCRCVATLELLTWPWAAGVGDAGSMT